MSKTAGKTRPTWQRPATTSSSSTSKSSAATTARRTTRSSVAKIMSDYHLDDSKEESSSSEDEVELSNEVFLKDVVVQVERMSLTSRSESTARASPLKTIKKRNGGDVQTSPMPTVMSSPRKSGRKLVGVGQTASEITMVPSSPLTNVKRRGVASRTESEAAVVLSSPLKSVKKRGGVDPMISEVTMASASPPKRHKPVNSTALEVLLFNEAKISLSSDALAELFFEQNTSKKLLFAKSKTGKRGLKYKTKSKVPLKDSKAPVKPDKMAPLNWEKFLECLEFPTEVERRLTDSCLDYLYGQFRDWLRLISLGSNLIFYGFGSKYDLLETFRQEMLSDFTQLVIRGYQPGFTLKSFLETLAKGLKVELPPSYATGRQKSSHLDILQYIKDRISQINQDIFILIHNIDGPQLRTEVVQQSLAFLADGTGANLHLIATVDHINAPLMWNHSKLSQFRWLWINSTTFAPYKEELKSGQSDFLTIGGGMGSSGHSIASLHSIWASLTQNAREVFIILARHLVKFGKIRGFNGLAFWELYRSCRDEFLVSSEAALHSQLVEFKDHRLVTTKRSHDGTEFLLITLDVDTLKEFLIAEGYEEFERTAEENEEAEALMSNGVVAEPTEQFGLEESDED